MRLWSSVRSWARRVASVVTAETLLADRWSMRSSMRQVISPDTAMRNSAVWACLRLRADLVSSMPVDVYRRVNGMRVDVAPPPVLLNPGALHVGGRPVRAREWLYATQVDLDRCGNTFGLITARNALGLPARIDLVSAASVTVRVTSGVLTYQIDGRSYTPDEVWHERQYVAAGIPVGLSPVAYAALTLGEYASAQELAIDWFGGSAIPAAHLKNTAKTLQAGEATAVRERYRAMVEAGGLFVTRSDWEFKPIQAVTSQADYLETRKAGLADVARFFGAPVDLIDAAVSGSSLTYTNLGERNMQFLIMHLGPAVARREDALSTLTATPRYVKLNRGALLAMDPKNRAETVKTQIDSRVLAPSEARALDDRLPFTDEQLAEFDRLFGARAVPATKTGAPA